MIYDLLDTEGLYLGASSALNVVAAVELADDLAPFVFCCFSSSTRCFHFFTTSFARSATAFDE